MFKLTTDDAEGQTPEITQTLDELAREGARRMIAVALEAEVAQYVETLRHFRDENGQAEMLQAEPEPEEFSMSTPWILATDGVPIHNI